MNVVVIGSDLDVSSSNGDFEFSDFSSEKISSTFELFFSRILVIVTKVVGTEGHRIFESVKVGVGVQFQNSFKRNITETKEVSVNLKNN